MGCSSVSVVSCRWGSYNIISIILWVCALTKRFPKDTCIVHAENRKSFTSFHRVWYPIYIYTLYVYTLWLTFPLNNFAGMFPFNLQPLTIQSKSKRWHKLVRTIRNTALLLHIGFHIHNNIIISHTHIYSIDYIVIMSYEYEYIYCDKGHSWIPS